MCQAALQPRAVHARPQGAPVRSTHDRFALTLPHSLGNLASTFFLNQPLFFFASTGFKTASQLPSRLKSAVSSWFEQWTCCAARSWLRFRSAAKVQARRMPRTVSAKRLPLRCARRTFEFLSAWQYSARGGTAVSSLVLRALRCEPDWWVDTKHGANVGVNGGQQCAQIGH